MRVLVTGGSRNLGPAIAQRFAQDGAAVAVGYHEARDEAEAVAAGLDGRHCAVGGDLADPEATRALVATAADRLDGPIDVLVNNAGPYGATPLRELSEAEWDSVCDANLQAAYVATQAVVPGMRQAGWGRVVMLSATSAFVRNRSIYGLAKAAVITLTEQLALELGPEITVNCVAPGQIAESLPDLREVAPEWAEQVVDATPAGRLVTRAEIADLVHVLCTPAFDLVTGATIPADGGLRLPRL